MKKVLSLFAVFFAFVFLISCGAKTGEETATKAEAPKKVAIVYSTGGKGDKSFNDSAYRGLEKAKAELGIEVSEYEPKDPTVEAKNQLTEYAQTGEYALIIGVGFTMKDSLQAVAKEYPDQKFALIDDYFWEKYSEQYYFFIFPVKKIHSEIIAEQLFDYLIEYLEKFR